MLTRVIYVFDTSILSWTVLFCCFIPTALKTYTALLVRSMLSIDWKSVPASSVRAKSMFIWTASWPPLHSSYKKVAWGWREIDAIFRIISHTLDFFGLITPRSKLDPFVSFSITQSVLPWHSKYELLYTMFFNCFKICLPQDFLRNVSKWGQDCAIVLWSIRCRGYTQSSHRGGRVLWQTEFFRFHSHWVPQ